MKMTYAFYRLVGTGEPYTVREWAYALAVPQYQFNSALRFSALTGVPYQRIKETHHAFTQTPRRSRTGDGDAVRDP